MFLAIVKTFDKILCHQWHSGSCNDYITKIDCEDRAAAEKFIHDVVNAKYKKNPEQYKFTTLVLEYSDSDASAVDEMFKYLR